MECQKCYLCQMKLNDKMVNWYDNSLTNDAKSK